MALGNIYSFDCVLQAIRKQSGHFLAMVKYWIGLECNYNVTQQVKECEYLCNYLQPICVSNIGMILVYRLKPGN